VRDFKKIRPGCPGIQKPAAGVDGESESKSVHHFGCLVGESPQIRRIYDLVERWGRPNRMCSFSGESAPGKELVAKRFIARAEE